MTSLLVVPHSLEDVSRLDRRRDLRAQADMTDQGLDPIDQVRTGMPLPVRQTGCRYQAHGHGFTMVYLSMRRVLDAVSEGVTEVEEGPLTLLLERVGLDNRNLDLNCLGDERLEVGEHARQQIARRCPRGGFDPPQQRATGYQAVFHDLGQAGREVPRRKGLQGPDIGKDRLGLFVEPKEISTLRDVQADFPSTLVSTMAIRFVGQ